MTRMTDPGTPSARPHRLRRVLWRTAWVLLAVISFCVTYALLVLGGR
jgi:hypothetical protein